ncbi:MAG: hypothetical protein COV09_01490 [Candidatus Vogelbacteria bacterium CG10_big_fil_rev_8_21_14_0_10_50_13]|uniref:Uncharacterized protein n=1 Tax=Candidatus Vogelbacteria bacterium CG10_big_fil_rev_8_21_14_0_10_50_13 TaxID=1975044 RepID=A0A2H0RFX7_9BACT|nr:MAG: hypothetical protein COV09_01490 [Candidatus Vogelbacteria bacterium CG10_big_fil_rev_8_21_14_0_10_50_13]
MADNPQSDKTKREEAKRALGGGAWHQARELEATEVEKRRQIARASMEGYDRRTRREEATAQARAEAEAKAKRETEITKEREVARQAEANKRQAEKQAEQAELAAKKRRLEKIHQAKEIITDLRQQTGANISPLRTYQGDLSRAQKDTNTVRQFLQNPKSRVVFQGGHLPNSHKNWWIIAGSLGLIIVGLTAVGLAWYFENGPGQQVTPKVALTANSLLPAENEVELYLTGKAPFELRAEVTQLIAASARDFAFAPSGGGSILAIHPTEALTLNDQGEPESKTSVNLNRFLAAMDLALPTEFRVALDDQFMFGVYQAPMPAPFYLFAVRSYERAASELLTDAGRVADTLFSPFANNPDLARRLRDQNFSDQVISNIDTRALLDEAGRPVMIYAFLDHNTLVFASSQAAFEKLVGVYRLPLPNR